MVRVARAMRAKRSAEDFLSSKKSYDAAVQVGMRDEVEIQKGVVLTEEYLEDHFKEISSLLNIFTAYPDIYLDIITPEGSNFSLFFYQRIILRVLILI